LIDSEGSEAFTMRRLADEMGIGVMTLYGYAASKEEIVEGAALLAMRDLHEDPGAGAAWDAHVRSAVHDLHEVCRRHPNLVTMVLEQSTPAPGLFRTREQILAALHDGGFDDAQALRAMGVLTGYVLGFASAQGAALFASGELIRELPADDFKYLARSADLYTQHVSDEAFEYGLELMLDGLRRERSGG
jgi:AcrR family transcriptional regulator